MEPWECPGGHRLKHHVAVAMGKNAVPKSPVCRPGAGVGVAHRWIIASSVLPIHSVCRKRGDLAVGRSYNTPGQAMCLRSAAGRGRRGVLVGSGRFQVPVPTEDRSSQAGRREAGCRFVMH